MTYSEQLKDKRNSITYDEKFDELVKLLWKLNPTFKSKNNENKK